MGGDGWVVGVVAEGRGALQGDLKEIRIIDHAGGDSSDLPGAADELEKALVAHDQGAFGAMGHKVAASEHMGLKAELACHHDGGHHGRRGALGEPGVGAKGREGKAHHAIGREVGGEGRPHLLLGGGGEEPFGYGVILAG
jgi:hypothetical protein